MAKYPPEYAPLDTNGDGSISVEEAQKARLTLDPKKVALAEKFIKAYPNGYTTMPERSYVTPPAVRPEREEITDYNNRYNINATMSDNGLVNPQTQVPVYIYTPETGGLPVAKSVDTVSRYMQKTYGNRLWDAIRNAFNLPANASNTQLEAIFRSELQAYSTEMYFRTQHAPEGSYGNQVTFLDWLKGGGSNTKGGGGGGAASPDKFATITGRQEAWQIFKAANKDLLGIIPTKDSFEKYYKELVAKQKTFTQSTTVSGTTQITTSNSLDVNAFTTAFIIKNSNLSGDLKGTAGQYQNWITQTAKSFGLDNKLTPEFTNKYLKGMLTGKYKQDDLTDAFRKQAKVLYTAFSQDLEENPEMTLEEIMQPYINLYANVFELGTNSINLSDVANFASSENGQKIGTYDFEKKLRADERFGYTKQANIEAGNLARSFARAFGVNV